MSYWTGGGLYSGSGSTTVTPPSGTSFAITYLLAVFKGVGSGGAPLTGRMTLKTGTTVLWAADVSGGLRVEFESWAPAGTDGPLTLECSGADCTIAGIVGPYAGSI